MIADPAPGPVTVQAGWSTITVASRSTILISSSKTVSILLADPDQMRREGLLAILSREPGFSVVGSAADGETAFHELCRHSPDVVVLDLNLPKIYGTELVRKIRGESPRTRVVVIAGTADDAVIRDAIRAGGDGYVLRTGPAQHLVAAIRHVLDGGRYFSPQLTAKPPDRVPVAAGNADDDLWDAEDTPNDSPHADTADRIEEIFGPLHERLNQTSARISGLGRDREPQPPRPRSWLRDHLSDPSRRPPRPAAGPARPRFRSGNNEPFDAGISDPEPGAATGTSARSARASSLFERLSALGNAISGEPVTARRPRRPEPPPPPPGGTKLGDILEGDADLSRNPGASLFGSEDYEKPPVRDRHRTLGSGRAKPLKIAWTAALVLFVVTVLGLILYSFLSSGLVDKFNQDIG